MLIRAPQIGSILESKKRTVQVIGWVTPHIARVTDVKFGRTYMLRLGEKDGWFDSYTEVTTTFNRKGSRYVKSTGKLLKDVMLSIKNKR